LRNKPSADQVTLKPVEIPDESYLLVNAFGGKNWCSPMKLLF